MAWLIVFSGYGVTVPKLNPACASDAAIRVNPERLYLKNVSNLSGLVVEIDTRIEFCINGASVVNPRSDKFSAYVETIAFQIFGFTTFDAATVAESAAIA
jgi:hypothetical protein